MTTSRSFFVFTLAFALAVGFVSGRDVSAQGFQPSEKQKARLKQAKKEGKLTMVVPVECTRTGCYGEVCTDKRKGAQVTQCTKKPEFACYSEAQCLPKNGKCGWVMTPDANACFAKLGIHPSEHQAPSQVEKPPVSNKPENNKTAPWPSDTKPVPQPAQPAQAPKKVTKAILKDGCVLAGCSNQLCVDASLAKSMTTTCEYRPQYACYEQATCARNKKTQQCSWQMDAKLEACIQRATTKAKCAPKGVKLPDVKTPEGKEPVRCIEG